MGWAREANKSQVAQCPPPGTTGWLEWASATNTSLPSSSQLLSYQGNTPPTSLSHLVQARALKLGSSSKSGALRSRGKHVEVNSPEWGIQRWHWTVAR